jgi:hypothetical protein
MADLARELAEELASRLRAARGGPVDWDVRPRGDGSALPRWEWLPGRE